INFDLHRFFGLVFAGALRLGILIVCFFLVRVLTLVAAFFLVALGRNRRRLVLAQNRDVDTARHLAIETRHIQPRSREAQVGAGREVKIFAVGVEDRILGVAHAVGYLVRLGLFERVEADRAQMV